MKIRQTELWKFFSSVKLAIWLLAIIAFFSLIGTFIPQSNDPAFYFEKYGRVGYGILVTTGLINVYASWWFILLLILFSMNLAACLVNRFSLKVASLGTTLVHASILVILIGALIGSFFGQKGYIDIGEGEETSFFVTQKNQKIEMGFSVKLLNFIYDEYVDPKEKIFVYLASKEGTCELNNAHNAEPRQKAIAEIPVKEGVEYDVADTGYKIKVLRYLPDFVMDTRTKAIVNRSAAPDNPAVEVELKDKNDNVSTSWVFAHFPDMHQKKDAAFRLVYNWVDRRPKDFISKVVFLKDGKELVKRDIRVNEPFRFGKYTFFQSGYDGESLKKSRLQAAQDSGVVVVYIGFILLLAGLIIIFYINPLARGGR